MNNAEADNARREFQDRKNKMDQLLDRAIDLYNSSTCQCAYPRFQQIVGIDCKKTGDSFSCFETETLIDKIKTHFKIEKSERNDENVNQLWICKRCGSEYEYGWKDFSIAVERQKLKLVHLKAEQIGKPSSSPIPLYLGLRGHSYPPYSVVAPVGFEDFERYMMEK